MSGGSEPDILERLLADLRERPARQVSDPAVRWAAVAAVLAPDPDALLLIRRAERAGDPWSGHMALPGGRRQADDPDLLATAIRETAEEVGFRLVPADAVAAVDDVAPMSPVLPPIAVRPYVFRLSARPALRLNPEVAAAAWVPLDTLLHPETYRTVTVQTHGASRLVPAYRFEEAVVWGLTERILSSLFGRIRGPQS